MIRSAKLLPLCKGARTWLVAGTIYGPKATTDGSSNGDDNNNNNNRSNTSNNSRNHQNRREDTFEARRYSQVQQNRPDRSDEFTHHAKPKQTPNETTTKAFAVEGAAAFRSARKYPDLPSSADGLVGVERLSVYKSVDTSVPGAEVKPKAEVPKSGKTPSESFSKPASASSNEAGPLEFNPAESLPAEPPIFSATPALYADLNCEFEKPSPAFAAANNVQTSSKKPAAEAPAVEGLQKDSKGILQVPEGHQYACSEASPGPAATAAVGSRKGNQNRHGNQRSNRSFNNGESHKLVARICTILHQHGWGTEALRALNGLHSNLNAYQVNEVLKQQKEAGLAYSFFIWARQQSGFKHDVHTYTTMLGILGRARNFEVLNNLLGEMITEGCKPNVVTYNRLIHCFGRANDLTSSLKFFNVMQIAGCEPDRVTYCTLIDLQAKAGFHDSAMELYKRMQQAGFHPDTFTYSIIIHCLGKAGKLNAAYKLFCEMTERGFEPSLVTYNIIIDLHAKAGKFDMALKLYSDMQEVGYVPDRVTYGIIMEVLGHCGHIEEAERVFQEMERAGWVADNPIFGLMVDLWGKLGNAEKAAEWFNRMLDSGLHPNVPACNSLLSAYLRACFYDAAAQVLHSMSKWGLTPTLQTYTSLLSSCASCQARWEYDSVFTLMGCTGHPAHPFLCSLLSGENRKSSEALPPEQTLVAVTRHFFDTMQFEELESRRGFADSLIDYLHRSGKQLAAGSVWQVAVEKNLYPYAIREKSPSYWSINLHVMSMGTALVVLSRTLASFRQALVNGGAPPQRIDIITGWGRRSRIPGASLVKQAVEDMLRSLRSPFYVDSANVGCFVGQGPALGEWLRQALLLDKMFYAAPA